MLANAPQTILIEGSEGDDTDLNGTLGDDKYIASGGSDVIDGMDGAAGGNDDTVLMVLEDYDTALTFDDFALEVI